MKYTQKIVQFWNDLEAKFIPPNAWHSDLLTLWREKIIFFLFFFAAVLGPFALIPSLILSFNERLWNIFILDSVAYLIVLVVLVSKKFSLTHKTWISFLIFYSLGMVLVFMLGFYGGGYIWLFGASLIVSAMLGLKAAGIALFINFIGLGVVGVFIAFGSPVWAVGIENSLEKWVVMIANFMFINALITLLVAVMLNSLKTALTSEQKTATQLRAKREELMAIFKASPDPVLVFDRLDYVQYLNDAFTSTFGWRLNEVQNKKIPFIPKDQLKISSDMFSTDTGKLRNTPIRFESKRHTKDGRLLNVLLSAAPIKKNGGGIVGSVVNIKDITESKKLELNLQQAQKMESIGTLAGGIAHDFNNILSPIMGHTEMLLMDTSENNSFKDSLNQIYNASIRARDLVKQILAFSRQDSNERTLMKMQPIIKEALKLIRSTIPTTIEIKQDIDPKCGKIKADPIQIHQILMNLSTNAYHAMEKTGGELKVNLKEMELGQYDIIAPHMKTGLYACLSISDNGIGMDKELTQKIFDPFFTTKAIGKGTGMGLSVVHGIVTAMGGNIHVYSELEKGTDIHIYFPIEKNPVEKQNTQVETPIQGGTEHILFVDDEKSITAIGGQMLERLGYQVTSYTSSLEALEVFRSNFNTFDVVITDMAMPNMPGDILSREMMKIRHDIPIILCTGFSETMSEEKAGSLGIKGFLLKPIVMKDLDLKIREIVAQ